MKIEHYKMSSIMLSVFEAYIRYYCLSNCFIAFLNFQPKLTPVWRGEHTKTHTHTHINTCTYKHKSPPSPLTDNIMKNQAIKYTHTSIISSIRKLLFHTEKVILI